jgi:CubicO group peptidase (beta-lactamase class C family)
MKNFFILLFCYLFTGLIKTQAQNVVVPDRKDSVTVSRWLEEKHVPALGIGYIEDGKVSWIKLYGTLRTGVSATENAVFNVASITKTITTMVTLNLVNSGKWQLDGLVARYWTDPDVRDDPRSGKLTTRDILTHRTGFPNWRWDLPEKKLAFQFDPGTKYQYSGEGFEYLRQALEHKFHRSLEQLADSIIFKPLGMKDTHFTWKDSDKPRYAYPFDASGQLLDIYKNATISAADLLKTTIPDYCKFMLWMLGGGGISRKLFAEKPRPAVTWD